jgi:hypothetical protein
MSHNYTQSGVLARGSVAATGHAANTVITNLPVGDQPFIVSHICLRVTTQAHATPGTLLLTDGSTTYGTITMGSAAAVDTVYLVRIADDKARFAAAKKLALKTGAQADASVAYDYAVWGSSMVA